MSPAILIYKCICINNSQKKGIIVLTVISIFMNPWLQRILKLVYTVRFLCARAMKAPLPRERAHVCGERLKPSFGSTCARAGSTRYEQRAQSPSRARPDVSCIVCTIGDLLTWDPSLIIVYAPLVSSS